jgi:NAD(P)-dependent dehydrogenase (short-subunit alcohol dehydrogenase family)
VESSALITGGTGGLGAAVTRRFLDDGWRVVVPWVEERELDRVEPRDGLELARADLFAPDAVASVVALAAGEAGAPLGAVVNLVGGYAAGPRVHETEVEAFERQFELNLRPTFLVTRAALPHLVAAGGGAVVCMGTRAAVDPFPGAAAYASSKAAVIAFVRAVAGEYRDEGVRCNALLPSVIDTPANRAAMPEADRSRWVSPELIAATIAFLCSEDGAATSGAALPVYGRA